MIVNASSRTDIPAFYAEWFLKRLEAGYFDVRNPFHPQHVSRIYLENVDAFMFCTKNPLPLLPWLNRIPKPVLMDVTVTPYHSEVEPHVPDKRRILEGIQKMSAILGKEQITVRYDPVFVSERYSVDYHIRAFETLCTYLEGYVESIVISLLDEYKNTKKNRDLLGYRDLKEADLARLSRAFAASAARHHLNLFSCNEGNRLKPYGIESQPCFSQTRAYEMTGKVFRKWKARECGCVEMADIGVYNSCLHMCRYCYANFDEKQVLANYQQHDPNSSLLVGTLQPQDIVKVRPA